MTCRLPLGEGAYPRSKSKGDFMLPSNRDGDVLIVDPAATARKGDRVVLRTRCGEVMAQDSTKRVPGTGVTLCQSQTWRASRQTRLGGMWWPA